ncbi:MAG: hypothetical protein RQ899_14580 [Pseudomonadales bacterium]|nr:hypothetical protein [Pseudomonadales bacterium]
MRRNKHRQPFTGTVVSTTIKGACAIAMLALALINTLAAQEAAGPAPRMADGHPDLSGVWWTGGDLGSPGYGSSNKAAGTGPNGPKLPSFTELYQPWAAEHAKTLSDKDDPTLQCRSTAFGTLSVRLFDVGTLGQIIATPAMMVFLQETFHGYQLIPTDGRAFRTVPPSFRGDAVGHWEGDTFVVETKNFTDDTWIFAEGRVSFHSDQLRVVERYMRPDARTLVIDATVYDDNVLTAPWVVPTQTLTLAPFDQLLPLICTGVETQELMDAAAELK